MEKQIYQLYSLLKNIVECCQSRESFQARVYDLTVSEARCLLLLSFDNCCNTSELAEKMGVAKSRITRIVDGLVAKKLVTRREDKIDRRITVINLTPKGDKIAREHANFMFLLHGEVLKSLPDNLHDDTLKLLNALGEAMNAVKAKMESGQLNVDQVNTETR